RKAGGAADRVRYPAQDLSVSLPGIAARLRRRARGVGCVCQIGRQVRGGRVAGLVGEIARIAVDLFLALGDRAAGPRRQERSAGLGPALTARELSADPVRLALEAGVGVDREP